MSRKRSICPVARSALISPKIERVGSVAGRGVVPGTVNDAILRKSALDNVKVPAFESRRDTPKDIAGDAGRDLTAAVVKVDPRRIAVSEDADHLFFYAHKL